MFTSDSGGLQVGRLLDALLVHYGLKNDAALSRRLRVHQAIISKVRNGRCAVSADLMVRMHDTFGLSLHDLRGLMGGHERGPDAPMQALVPVGGAVSAPATAAKSGCPGPAPSAVPAGPPSAR